MPLHYKTRDVAAAKYAHLKDDQAALQAALKADEKNFPDDDIAEIIHAINNPIPVIDLSATSPAKGKPKVEDVKQAQANHPTLKWFDIFEIRPNIASFKDEDTNEVRAVITHFDLGKKLKSVFIEPELVTGLGDSPGFNHYAIGNDQGHGGGPAKLYLPKDQYKFGSAIQWDEVVKMMNFKPNHPNTRKLKKYRELQP